MLGKSELQSKLVTCKDSYTRVDTVALSVSLAGTAGLGVGLRLPIAESIGFCDKHLLSTLHAIEHHVLQPRKSYTIN